MTSDPRFSAVKSSQEKLEAASPGEGEESEGNWNFESWREIKGYEGYYEVSTFGQVRSLDRKVLYRGDGSMQKVKGRMMSKQCVGEHVFVGLSKEHKQRQRRVSVLVLETFTGLRPDGMEVSHINKDPLDNRLANLLWVKKRSAASCKKQKLEERFWAKVQRGSAEDCWEWLSSCNKKGYGTFFYMGKSCLAHRISYLLEKGPIPKGKLVLHTCDKPKCVNVQHLYLGTHRDNSRDMMARGRSAWQTNKGFILECLKRGRAKCTVARGDQHYFRRHPEAIMRGSNHANAKLNEGQVREIRDKASHGALQRELAVEFGVTRSTIGLIVRRKLWKHVE